MCEIHLIFIFGSLLTMKVYLELYDDLILSTLSYSCAFETYENYVLRYVSCRRFQRRRRPSFGLHRTLHRQFDSFAAIKVHIIGTQTTVPSIRNKPHHYSFGFILMCRWISIFFIQNEIVLIFR